MEARAVRNTGTTDGQNVDEAGLIDLRRVGSLLRRRWPVIAAVSAVVILLTFLAYHFATPLYSATATVAIDRHDDELASAPAAPALATDSPSVDTEAQVLASPALAGVVVDRLGLASDPEFAGKAPVSHAVARENAINSLILKTLIKRVGLSYAISVTTTTAVSPEKAARVANEIVNDYVAGGLGGKETARQREVTLLSARIGQLRGEVIATEAAIARYRAANGLVDVNPTGTAAAAEESALNAQIATAQAEQAAAQARLGTARAQLARGRSGEALGAALASDTVRALRAQQAQLSAQRADLVGRYGPLHPDLARTDRQLADIDARIKAEVTRIVSNLETEASVAAGRTSSLQASINRAQGSLAAQNAASVRLNELQRNADSARSLYQAFLDRYRGAVARQGTDQGTAHVIAHALPAAGPTSPNPIVYSILAIVGALLASAVAVALLELLENGVRSSAAVQSKLGVPSIGLVPDIASVPNSGVSRRNPVAPADFLLAKPASMFAESFRSIRTAIRRAPGGDLTKVIAITSALPDEGKTTTAICLARSAAQAGLKVVLIDADLRQRASSRTLTADVSAGLAEVLAGKVPLERALVVDSPSGAMLLPQTSAGASLDLMGSPGMQQLIERLRDSFDLILLDCAPVLPVAEARQAAAIADRTILVLRWSKTPVRAANLALNLLDQVGAKVAGVVLTRANVAAIARSGDSDAASFYHQYAKYYA